MLERLFSLLHEDLNSSWGEESNGASHVKQLEYKLYHYQNRRLCLNENCEDERLAKLRIFGEIEHHRRAQKTGESGSTKMALILHSCGSAQPCSKG